MNFRKIKLFYNRYEPFYMQHSIYLLIGKRLFFLTVKVYTIRRGILKLGVNNI